MEEREIIGYEAPRDLFGKRIKAGTVFTKCAITTVSFEYIHGQTILPAEIVETWKPVYREKPVFKVGDWVKLSNGNVGQITRLLTNGFEVKTGDSCFTQGTLEGAIFATPEEIEAAKPKPRKYMQQVWYILTLDINCFNITHVSQRFETESEANAWLLEIAQEDRVYSVKPFEVVAYE